jgi:hypothetical protein
LAAFGAPLISRVSLNVWIPQKECPINQELGIRVLTHREPELDRQIAGARSSA